MASGRCEGCGRTGSSTKIYQHVVECELFLKLPPGQMLDPLTSYANWQAEGKKAHRTERKQDLTTQEVVLRAAADARWATPRDILED
jgi:hypothetical protein